MRFLLPPDRGSVRGAARAAVLAEWMTAWLQTPVQVELATTYRALAVEIEAGRVELAWAPPAVCARLRAGARSLLSVVRHGASAYAAALVVRRDSDLHRLEDLRGTRASWVDPLSTSGHLLALAHLRERGFAADDHFREQRFAGNARDALADVAEGRADVSSFYVVAGDDELTLREIADLIGPSADGLRLLDRTAPAPFDALVVGQHAHPELEARIAALDRRASPPAMLLEVCRADRFVPAEPADYARFEHFCEALLG